MALKGSLYATDAWLQQHALLDLIDNSLRNFSFRIHLRFFPTGHQNSVLEEIMSLLMQSEEETV